MKILHLGDLHLGKRVNEISMIEDQKFILDQIVTLVKEEKIDVLPSDYCQQILLTQSQDLVEGQLLGTHSQ